MRIALIQRHATTDRLLCDLDLATLEDSSARRLFLKHRRPELYGDWL